MDFFRRKLIKNSISFLSFGKLRASYGTTGSDQIGDYKYLTRWSSNGTQNYLGTRPLQPTQHANPDYRWQLTKKIEAALDLGFLNDYITVSVAYYRNRCSNQLIDFPISTFTGFGSVVANSPALVQNDGWEFTANAKIIERKNFKWSISFNTSANKNKLVAYPKFDQSPYFSIYEIGKSLNIARILHFTGVDPQTGLYTFEDKTKDGEISTNPGVKDDRFIQELNPQFFGGVGMNFNYRNLQLNLFFNIKKQTGPNAINQTLIPGAIYNQPLSIFEDRWQKIGDNAKNSKFTTQLVPGSEFQLLSWLRCRIYRCFLYTFILFILIVWTG